VSGRAAFLALALLAAGAAAQDHTVAVEPRPCAVGEPIRVICDVPHAAGGGAWAREPELDPADPWVFLDAAREELGAEATRLTWRLLALDPERPTPPELGYALRADAGADARSVAVAAPAVELAGELAAGEDAPRPLIGLRELPARFDAPPAGTPARMLLSAAFALVVLLLGASVWVRRRRALAARGRADRATPAERIAALAAAEMPGKARHYELTRLVRQALDERAGKRHAGWTDAELADALAADAELRGKLGDAACDAAAELLRRAAPAKYAGALPTDFAVRETFELAQRAFAAEARP
jgi:hypothetical protein